MKDKKRMADLNWDADRIAATLITGDELKNYRDGTGWIMSDDNDEELTVTIGEVYYDHATEEIKKVIFYKELQMRHWQRFKHALKRLIGRINFRLKRSKSYSVDMTYEKDE